MSAPPEPARSRICTPATGPATTRTRVTAPWVRPAGAILPPKLPPATVDETVIVTPVPARGQRKSALPDVNTPLTNAAPPLTVSSTEPDTPAVFGTSAYGEFCASAMKRRLIVPVKSERGLL